jgi:CRP-like cAMP-binding protein
MLARGSAAGRLAEAQAGWSVAAAPGRRAAGLDRLEQFGSHRIYRRGQQIHAAGDPAEFGYRIVGGCVRALRVDAEGRRQVAEFLLPGDLFGFDSLDTHHLTAEALTGTAVVRYPLRAVEALAERDGALARRLRDLTRGNLRRAHRRMFLLGRTSALERLVAFLLEMVARMPSAGTGRIVLPMTRADIADHLGLTVETVSRALARLRDEGAISPAGAVIELRDPAVLGALGSEPHP